MKISKCAGNEFLKKIESHPRKPIVAILFSWLKTQVFSFKLLSKLFIAANILIFSVFSEGKMSSKESERGIRIKNLLQFLIQVGFFKSTEDASSSPLVFTIIDSAHNLIPYENAVIEFDKGLIKGSIVVRADENGKIVLSFDKLMIEENPRIFAEKATYMIEFKFAGVGERGKPTGEVTIIDLSKIKRMKKLKVGDDIIFYESNGKNLAHQLAKYLPKLRKIISKVIGIEPTAWGMVLSVAPEPLHLAETDVNIKGKRYHLHPFSIPDGSPKDWYLTNIHEWTEITLNNLIRYGDEHVRWFSDGVSEYTKITFCRLLTKEERKKLGLEKLLNKELDTYRIYLEEQLSTGKEYFDFNLFAWRMPKPDKVVTEADKYGYPLSLFFWLDMEKRYGKQIISELVKKVLSIQNPTGEQIANILSQLTGENIIDNLKFLKIKEAKVCLDELLKELK